MFSLFLAHPHTGAIFMGQPNTLEKGVPNGLFHWTVIACVAVSVAAGVLGYPVIFLLAIGVIIGAVIGVASCS